MSLERKSFMISEFIRAAGSKVRETAQRQTCIKPTRSDLARLDTCYGKVEVTVQTSTKVVGIMRQNACPLAFCVQNLLSFTPQSLVCR